jgi:putative nucleotidyltransferase with HDIG domain
MLTLDDFMPQPPVWTLDWTGMVAAFPWLKPLKECHQDPLHHGEGDVLTHTRMVVEALISDPAWQALGDDDRAVLFAAALFHDIGKPPATRIEEGRITHRHHSAYGTQMTRLILWRMGWEFSQREQVCALIRSHQAPFWLIDRNPEDARLIVLSIALQVANSHLALLADADAKGRICGDLPRILDHVALFREIAADHGVLHTPYPFPSDHTRVTFFRNPHRDPAYEAYDDTKGEMILLSGLPGSGKSTWTKRNCGMMPTVSLDVLRHSMGVKAESDAMGTVVQAAKEAAREQLRTGSTFVWDATALPRVFRKPIIDLAADYGYRTRIVYMETTEEQMLARNRSRPDSQRVPDTVIAKMLMRWEPPTLAEAHSLEIHASDILTLGRGLRR